MTSSLALLGEASAEARPVGEYVPHVIAWNLTRRCNLECAHCYIAAGPNAPSDGELSTNACLRIADEILALNPAPMFILSGGEPLLRDDLATIASYAARRGATVVVGTNGTLLTDEKIVELKDAGVTGVAVSIESLNAKYHDRFRRGHGSLEATRAAVRRLQDHRLDFIVQTTLTRANSSELANLVDWAAEQGAVSFNAYFLVNTGRGTKMSDLSPQEYEELLGELVGHHERHLGRMMVRAKCAPHFMRLVHQRVPQSPILNYETRCPCGTQYCRVTPDGKLTACPYLPVAAGDLRTHSFSEVWHTATLFKEIRSGKLDGKCGVCEYRGLCGGCRARAFAQEGDYLASDASCAYEPTGTAGRIERPRSTTYGMEVTRELTWTADAEARLTRIPSFVRGVVVQRIERYAQKQGASEVTVELMNEVRRAIPVDFSKRKPFFLRNDD